MFVSLRKIRLLLLSGVLFSLIGCASTGKMPQTGFLEDYDHFAPVEGKAGLYYKRYVGSEITEYKKIIVAPIEIYFDAESKRVPEEMLVKMKEDLYQSLVEKLSEAYEVVDQPGEGVVIIKTAITDIRANKIYLNLHWATTLSGLGTGGATIEAEFVDSLSQKIVLSVVSTRKGNRAKYFHGLSKWGHTKGVVHGWAQLLIDSLNEFHD